MQPTHPDSAATDISLRDLVYALADTSRWRILSELSKEPLPATELAKRLGISVSSSSKHCAALRSVGIVQRGYGNLYRIKDRYLAPGTALLDLGCVQIRLDRVGGRR